MYHGIFSFNLDYKACLYVTEIFLSAQTFLNSGEVKDENGNSTPFFSTILLMLTPQELEMLSSVDPKVHQNAPISTLPVKQVH